MQVRRLPGAVFKPSLDDFPLARDHLQRLGDILPQLRQPRTAAGRTRARRRNDDALTGQLLGKGLSRGALAIEGSHARGLVRCHLGGEVVLAGGGFQLFELQLELIEQATTALGARAMLLALEFGDLELEMRDQRLGRRGLGLCDRKLRFGLVCARRWKPPAPWALRHRSEGAKRRLPWPDGEYRLVEAKNAALRGKSTPYPALAGRQLYCGLRQSIPSSRQASCALLSATIPSLGSVRNFACGRAVDPYAAMALMKRSPKMTANWALAMDHSRGGILHSFSERFKIR